MRLNANKKRMKKLLNHTRKFIVMLCAVFIFSVPYPAKTTFAETNTFQERLALYKKTAVITNVPWYYLAAVDQYERSVKTNVPESEIISLRFSDELWFGLGNPSSNLDSRIIALYNGIGKDGNGDGKADPENSEDILFSLAVMLASNGISDEDIKITLWQYYQRDLSVKTIMNTARVYEHFNTNELLKRDFPVDIKYNYSYQSTWGAGRGFGGRRIHEGTDIFANYGTPALSTTYGVVELKGWNLYGGWRIGIRDIHNIYHYYAHLNAYNDELEVGDIVQPGDVLGTVGSTGYGPPGTAGKFPPHLHYGMYKDNGINEWSFDPYPYLRRWEQMAKKK